MSVRDTTARTDCDERTRRLPCDPAVGAFLGMARFVHRAERLVGARLHCDRLNAGQLEILLQISAAEGLTQQDLAARLCHTKANVSQLLDKMEASGLARRQPEGRAYAIYLTDAGRAALGTAVPETTRLITELFAPLAVEEQAALFRLVAKLDPGDG